MKALNVFLSIFVSLLLCAAVLEVGLRVIGFGPPKTLNEFHETLGWAKRPDTSVTRKTKEYEVTFEMNELGLRDDPMSGPEKAPGTFRVIALGDSFTLGFAVQREDLFVDQLEGWWQSEGRNVEVINTGTEAYSTDQEALWLIENADAFQPDLVLLFPYENDIYWNGQSKYQRLPKPLFRQDGTRETQTLEDPGERGFLANLALVRTAKRILGRGTPTKTFTPDGGTQPILEEFAPILKQRPAFIEDPIGRTKGALAALKNKCDAVGAKLVVAPIPSHSAIDPEFGRERFGPRLGLSDDLWSADKPVDLFLGLASSLGITALDVRPAFRALHAQGEKLYYDVDWHIDPAGNRAFATFLHDELEALDVFPATVAKQQDGGIPDTRALAGGTGMPTWSKWFLGLWGLLGVGYASLYRDENSALAVLKVGALLAMIFTIAVGGTHLLGLLPPAAGTIALVIVVLAILGFVLYKLGDRVGTILELFRSFVMRGHWYLLPLVVVLLTVGSLLVVAASSPLVAPFIYTLF